MWKMQRYFMVEGTWYAIAGISQIESKTRLQERILKKHKKSFTLTFSSMLLILLKDSLIDMLPWHQVIDILCLIQPNQPRMQ